MDTSGVLDSGDRPPLPSYGKGRGGHDIRPSRGWWWFMRRKRTERGLHYRALAEGYKILNPTVAASFELAAEHYDQSDPPLALVAETGKAGDDEREKKAVD